MGTKRTSTVLVPKNTNRALAKGLLRNLNVPNWMRIVYYLTKKYHTVQHMYVSVANYI